MSGEKQSKDRISEKDGKKPAVGAGKAPDREPNKNNPAAPAQAKGQKIQKKQKGNSHISQKKQSAKGLTILLVIVILIGAAAAVLYYSGKLVPLLESAGFIKKETVATMSEEELIAWENKLTKLETTLKEKKAELDTKEQELADKEQELIVKENNLKIYGQESSYVEEYTQTFQEMITGLTDEEVDYYKRMSVIYAKMAPEEAVKIINELYDIQKTSAIIYYMQPAASALILAKMDQDTAAKITEIILN